MDIRSYILTLLGLLVLHFGYTCSNVTNNNNNINNSYNKSDDERQNFKDNLVLRDSSKIDNHNYYYGELLLPPNQPTVHEDYEKKSLEVSDEDVDIDDDVDDDVDDVKESSSSDLSGKNIAVKTISSSSSSSGTSETSDELTLSDQVRLLTKQLNALMTRRREDYKLLENSLKKSLRKSATTIENVDMDIKAELEELRHEVKMLREGRNGIDSPGILSSGSSINVGRSHKISTSTSNKERLTVEWLTQSIAEMRKELTELQEIASNASKDLTRRRQTFQDLATITNDFKLFKLELEALKHRQEKNEVFVRELREEAVQKEEDIQKMIHSMNRRTNNQEQENKNSPKASENSLQAEIYKHHLHLEPEADHRMRHQRFIRQQLHELEESQRSLQLQLNELHYHRMGDRVRNLEIEQHRLASANFNLSRQISNLDKLHGSMLELLEDVEGIQQKMDKSVPEIKREISKLEFQSAQLNSEQSLLREEGHNAAKSIQAMAVSVSTLQEERDNFKDMQNTIEKLQEGIERLQSAGNVHKSILKERIEKMETDSLLNATMESIIVLPTETLQQQKLQQQYRVSSSESVQIANNLVQQLESVELQFESIINKLPEDCSQIHSADSSLSSSTPAPDGLYLIAPTGQHRPILSHCSNGWTYIQRRFDGSVDFNRSWEIYAQGFGSPSGEFWIGNEVLHHLTNDNCTQLQIIMQDIYDNTWKVLYSHFYISARDDGFRLHVSGYTGNASDALDYQNRMQFSAIDVDRDISNTHCAANYEGGWWFSHCQHANLNGRYNLGLTWFDAARNEWIAVKSSQMMVSKRQHCMSGGNNGDGDHSHLYASAIANDVVTGIETPQLTTASSTTTITTVV